MTVGQDELPERRDPVTLAEWIVDRAIASGAARGHEAIDAAAASLLPAGVAPELAERARLLAVGAYYDGRGDGLGGAAARLARARGALEPARRNVPDGRRLPYVGRVRSPWTTLEGMPLQTVAAGGVRGTVELRDDLAPAARDLGAFSHLWLLCDLHRSAGFELEVVPFLDTERRSLFATRSPRRPSPIGLSLVRLIGVEGAVLHVEELDLLDGTPVLDLKPYVPLFDSRPDVRSGWFSGVAARVFEVRSAARYQPPPEEGEGPA
ncbi:MAG: tRNA (N6-threonylcarbamoyladenosine(37)-N6)-methyltransferase TrmO [Thermoleophilia bacterium]